MRKAVMKVMERVFFITTVLAYIIIFPGLIIDYCHISCFIKFYHIFKLAECF